MQIYPHFLSREMIASSIGSNDKSLFPLIAVKSQQGILILTYTIQNKTNSFGFTYSLNVLLKATGETIYIFTYCAIVKTSCQTPVT